MIAYYFYITVSCFCLLPAHHQVPIGPFGTFEGCEQLRQEMAPQAPACEVRDRR